MSWESVVADFQANLWLYLAMPLVAGAVGYITKMLAIQMMFKPMEFIGIGPIGWQGIVPKKAAKMALTSADMMLDRLFKVEELMQRLDPQRMLKEIEEPLMKASEEMVREIGEKFLPDVWMAMPEIARRQMIKRMQREIPSVTEKIWDEVSTDVNRYLDIKHMLTHTLTRDKELLNNLFAKVGKDEFIFFRNAGFWFGLGLGFIQLICWLIWHEPWILPAFGAFVGLSSDWLCLQMMFRPMAPKKILGMTFQGKFMSRQKEVSRDYAEILAKELLTPANMVEELLRGPAADRLVELMHRHIRDAADKNLGVARPLVMLTMGSSRYKEIREFAVEKILEMMPDTMAQLEDYTMDAMDINNTIVARMEALTPQEFEDLLRPVFKEDEMTLVFAGAALGFIIGELQVQVMLPFVTLVN